MQTTGGSSWIWRLDGGGASVPLRFGVPIMFLFLLGKIYEISKSQVVLNFQKRPNFFVSAKWEQFSPSKSLPPMRRLDADVLVVLLLVQ